MSVGDAIKFAPFRVLFDRAASFARKDNNRPYVLLGEDGVIDVMMLHRDLVGAALKFSDRERAFPRTKIHLTMLYDDRQLEAQAIEPISSTAHEFVLIESWRGQARHIERGKWSLAGLALEAMMTVA